MESSEDPQSQLLEACPFCGYSLEGLPTEHACPECGKAYDRRWRVFGDRPRWYSMSVRERTWAGFTVVALSFGCVGIGFEACASVSFLYVCWKLFCLLMIGPMVGLMAWRLFCQPESFVVVGYDYAQIVHRKLAELNRKYPLRELRKAEKVGLTDLARTSPRESVLAVLIDTRSEAKRCAAYIDSLVDQVGSPA